MEYVSSHRRESKVNTPYRGIIYINGLSFIFRTKQDININVQRYINVQRLSPKIVKLSYIFNNTLKVHKPKKVPLMFMLYYLEA